MSGLVSLRAARNTLVVAIVVFSVAFTPVLQSHDIACAHDKSGVCSASVADRMDKGDSIFDPAQEPGPPGPSPVRAADASKAGF